MKKNGGARARDQEASGQLYLWENLFYISFILLIFPLKIKDFYTVHCEVLV